MQEIKVNPETGHSAVPGSTNLSQTVQKQNARNNEITKIHGLFVVATE